MTRHLELLTRIGDKSGSLGAIVAAMGCAVCFPAIASLGAALGLGFLAQWEGFLLTRVLPAAAWLTLVVHAVGYLQHRHWYRALAGMAGPAAILLILEFYFATPWRADAIYAALALMVIVSAWDLWRPARRRCEPGTSPTVTADTADGPGASTR